MRRPRGMTYGRFLEPRAWLEDVGRMSEECQGISLGPGVP